MATQYKVKKGDTLSGIAKQYGVGIGDISGYRSGNADRIFEGETLTIGSAPKNEAETYASNVKDELSGTDTGSKSKGSSLYDLDSLKTEVGDYKSKLDSSFKKLQTIQTETFDREYKDRGLAEKKQKMSELDGKIAEERRKRDDAIAKVRSNPGLSASQMTGDVKKIADYQNDVINGYINERNGLASEYNAELDEIDKVVAREAAEAGSEYTYYKDLLSGAEGKIGDYSKALTEELKANQDEDQFTRQLEQALTIAQLRADGGGSGSNLRLVSDGLGGFVLFDPDTGDVSEVNPSDTGDDEEDGGGSAIFNKAAQEQASGSTEPWYSKLWGSVRRGLGF